MATEHSDTHLFPGLSLIDIQLNSNVGAASENWSGYSLDAASNPLRSLSPAETDAATIARFVTTLVMDLLKPRA